MHAAGVFSPENADSKEIPDWAVRISGRDSAVRPTMYLLVYVFVTYWPTLAAGPAYRELLCISYNLRDHKSYVYPKR